MTDIFVSYANEDREWVRRLSEALIDSGWSLFWDRTIPAGKRWREIIGTQLEQARCMIVVWSTASVRSGWVQEEAEEGSERGILVPVFCDDVKPPIGFRGIQGVSLVHWDGTQTSKEFSDLKDSIRRVLSSASSSESNLATAKHEVLSGIAAGDKIKGSAPASAQPRRIETNAREPSDRNWWLPALCGILLAVGLDAIAATFFGNLRWFVSNSLLFGPIAGLTGAIVGIVARGSSAVYVVSVLCAVAAGTSGALSYSGGSKELLGIWLHRAVIFAPVGAIVGAFLSKLFVKINARVSR